MSKDPAEVATSSVEAFEYMSQSRAIITKYFNPAPVWKVSFQNKKIIDINKALLLK
jgi:hypothetical protein